MQETTPLQPVDRGPSPDEPLIERERAGQLHAALATLADDYRKVLVLREIEGFDYHAIAEVLDLPIGTVRSRLFRARMQLREQLRATMGPELGDASGGEPGSAVACQGKASRGEPRGYQDTSDLQDSHD